MNVISFWKNYITITMIEVLIFAVLWKFIRNAK
jgi:hypothetical protein